jgi:serine/threonine protein kinase
MGNGIAMFARMKVDINRSNNSLEQHLPVCPEHEVDPTPINRTQLPNDMNEEKIHHNYHCEYYLGQGAGSVVFLGKNKRNGTTVAIKRIHLSDPLNSNSPHGLDAIINELKIIKRMDSHPSLVKLQCAFRHRRYCYFVMDHLTGGDLRQLIRHHNSLSQQSIVYVIACIGSALNHLHRHQIIHRDVKPENIGFDGQGRPYLFDFGISYSIPEEKACAFICSRSSGTLAYLAPEVLTPTHRHSYQSDFWSLGIVAYELVYHQKPHNPHVPKTYVSYSMHHYGFRTDDLSPTPPAGPYFGDEQNLIAAPAAAAPATVSQPPAIPIYTHNLITLLPDFTIPLYLMHSYPITRTPFPPRPAMDLVRQEMIQLLSGLLEIRIPYRLGALDRFRQFTHQSIFLMHGYHDLNRLPSLTSPLLSETAHSLFPFHVNPTKLLPVDHNCSQEEEDSLEISGDNVTITNLDNRLEGLFPYIPSPTPALPLPPRPLVNGAATTAGSTRAFPADYLDPHSLSQPNGSNFKPPLLSPSISSKVENEANEPRISPPNLTPLLEPSMTSFHNLI